jgi:ribonucleotide monophosphatase NagD (HAD superfamily)
VAALVASTGREPRTIGKPEPFTLQWILDRSGATPDECLVIGDRLDTDIALGRRVGTWTALVLTGVTNEADAEAAPECMRPHFVWPDLRSLE